MTLDPVQIRVLGSLIEKEIATPENYPLSLNALVNACNQRSSRDPVLNLSEEEVRPALRTLEDEDLVAVEHSSRVEKYEHRIRTVLDLRRDETALLCLLFLRGPQTPGELRARADRLYNFDGLDAVESTLARMTAAPDPASGPGPAPGNLRPLAVMLPRQPDRANRVTRIFSVGRSYPLIRVSPALAIPAPQAFTRAILPQTILPRMQRQIPQPQLVSPHWSMRSRHSAPPSSSCSPDRTPNSN